jgi:WD40 repeat protein
LLAVSPDGSAVAAVGVPTGQAPQDGDLSALDRSLTVVDVASEAPRFSRAISPPPAPTSVAWQPDGEALALVTLDGDVSLIDARSGDDLGEPVQLLEDATALQFSHDGDVLMIADLSGALRPLDVATRRVGAAQTVPGGGAVVAMDLVPGNSRFVAADASGSIHLVDALTGHAVGQPLEAGPANLVRIAVSPDGDYLAALDLDRSLRLWDMRTGRQLGPPIQEVGGVGQLAYLDDGHILVADGPNGAVFLDLDPASWLATACRLAGREGLTREEWTSYLPDEPYRRTCSER